MLMKKANAARRPPSKLMEDESAIRVDGQAAKKIEKL